MSVNPASLMRKCEAGDIGPASALSSGSRPSSTKTEGITAEEKEYLLALLKNPGESGVDLKKDLFFFMSMDGTVDAVPDMSGAVCCCPIGDKAKLDALLARIGEKERHRTRHRGRRFGHRIWAKRTAAVSGLCAYNDVAVHALFRAERSPDKRNRCR